MRRASFGFSLLFAFLFFTACASNELAESNSAEAAFKAAQELENDERYEEAITKFNEVKNKHPYSKFAVEAELHVADIHFKRESYLEAQTAYQLFKDFHPKYSKIDYVTFRLALSFFNELPDTIDRDLTPAFKAIQYFDEVIHSFSSSGFVPEAKEKREKSLRMLAEKEAYIGNFYFKRQMYDSAQHRYEGLLEKYSGHGLDEEALYRAGVAAFESGDKDAGNKHLKDLITKFPASSYIGDAKSALEKYGHR